MDASYPPPPRLATRLLTWLLQVEDTSVLGDLEEEYYDRCDHVGVPAARRAYQRQVIIAAPALLFYNLTWYPTMLKNHLMVAARTLWRHKGFSAVTIFGLAVSLAVALLILTFLRDQALYDHFHATADRLYRVTTEVTPPDGTPQRYAVSPMPLADALAATLPTIETVVQLRRLVEATSFQDERLGVQGFYAGPSFFRAFSFPLQAGDPEHALADPYSIVLSKTTAHKLFGTEEVTGRTLTIADVGDFTVTGVFSALPRRSHLDFEAVASLSTLDAMKEAAGSPASWETLDTYTYLVLNEGASPRALEAKVPDLVNRYYAADQAHRYTFQLQAATAINLGPVLAREVGPVTPRAFGYFLGVLAGLIVLAACINYVNLSVARSMQRAREVGVRKALGAYRRQITAQFLSEAVVVALAALGVAFILLAGVLLPRWNALELVQTDFGTLALFGMRDLPLYLGFVVLGVTVGLGAGFYPARYLSRLRPVQALKGHSRRRGRSTVSLRKGLIVFQFALSLVFMISTLLIYQQSVYLLNADFGFAHAHRLNVELSDVSYETLRHELLRHPDVRAVSATSALPSVTFSERAFLRSKEAPDSARTTVYAVDPPFIENMELDLVAGRNLSDAFATDRGDAVLLNETAVRMLRLGTPDAALGQWVAWGEEQHRRRVVGVVKDFQFDFLWRPVTPLALHYNPAAFRYATVQYRPGMLETVQQHLESTWARLPTEHPLSFYHFDDQIDANYSDFQDFVWIVGFLAGLAIAIACLGLLALAHYQTALRTKEIGVRKALGASVPNLVVLLSKGFAGLVALAVLVAVPAAWFLNGLWLQIMANRITMEPGIYVVSIAVLVGLALVAIGSQTVRAALMNPVKTLRYE